MRASELDRGQRVVPLLLHTSTGVCNEGMM